MKSDFSEVNGLKLYYELYGEKGEYLVLIHGGGSTIKTTFGKVISFLSGEFQVIAVELQAHGHTADRDTPESFEQDADDVAQLLKNLSIPKASFFGFSNGGNTAMRIAMRHPELVNKLVIASAFYKRKGLQPGLFDGLEKATIEDMPLPLRTAFLNIRPNFQDFMNMFNKDRDRMIHFKDWKEEEVKSIKFPALIICGDRDVVTVSHTVEMNRLIVNSRLMIIPGTHGSYIGVEEDENPKEEIIKFTIEVIMQFLKE